LADRVQVETPQPPVLGKEMLIKKKNQAKEAWNFF